MCKLRMNFWTASVLVFKQQQFLQRRFFVDGVWQVFLFLVHKKKKTHYRAGAEKLCLYSSFLWLYVAGMQKAEWRMRHFKDSEARKQRRLWLNVRRRKGRKRESASVFMCPPLKATCKLLCQPQIRWIIVRLPARCRGLSEGKKTIFSFLNSMGGINQSGCWQKQWLFFSYTILKSCKICMCTTAADGLQVLCVFFSSWNFCTTQLSGLTLCYPHIIFFYDFNISWIFFCFAESFYGLFFFWKIQPHVWVSSLQEI